MGTDKDISGRPLPLEMEHPSVPPSPPVSSTKDSDPHSTFHSFAEPVQDSQAPGSKQSALEEALDSLEIHNRIEMAERMFSSLGVVFQHAIEQHGIDLGIRDWNPYLRQAEEANRRGMRDEGVLRWIRTVLDQLLASDSEDLVQAAEILANGSRDGN